MPHSPCAHVRARVPTRAQTPLEEKLRLEKVDYDAALAAPVAPADEVGRWLSPCCFLPSSYFFSSVYFTCATVLQSLCARPCASLCAHSTNDAQVELDMHVTLADGDVTIASSDDGGFIKMCSTFAAFVAARTAAA